MKRFASLLILSLCMTLANCELVPAQFTQEHPPGVLKSVPGAPKPRVISRAKANQLIWEAKSDAFSAAMPKWITGYYPYWWYDAVKPEQVDMSSITHLILFNASPNPNTSPYLTGISAVEGGTNLTRILSLAHAKGVKVILSLGGIYGTEAANMRAIANDAAKSAVFAKYASDYALSKGIDGLEMDWEFPQAPDRTGWNRLNRLIRNELDKWPTRGIFICAAYARTSGATDSYFAYLKDSMIVYFDQINAMTYTMWQGNDQDYRSGFDTPVNPPTQFSGYNGYNLSQHGPMAFVNAGYPASKIGASISFEGTKFSGVTTMGQKYTGWAFCSSAARSAGSGYASIPTSGRRYDAVAQAAWCVSGSTVYSFQDTNSVQAIAGWAYDKGFGGVMIYDFPAGHDLAASPPDILLKVTARAIRGGAVPPPPPPPVELPTGLIDVVPLSLGYLGGPVTVLWSSTGATSASVTATPPGLWGTVAGTSGNRAVSISASTSFQLTVTNSAGSRVYSRSVVLADPPSSLPNYDSVATLWYFTGNAAVNRDSIFQAGVTSVTMSVDSVLVHGHFKGAAFKVKK